MEARRKLLLTAVIAFVLVPCLSAITVEDLEIRCPICKTVNKVPVVGSYGSYACFAEGELDLVPCPIAYTGSIWTCSKCRFTVYVGDEKIPEEKVSAVERVLAKLPGDLNVADNTSETWKTFSMSDRLFVAEGVYRCLGRDSEFWASFYRVAGYFAARESKTDRARRLRARALTAYQLLLQDRRRADLRKQDLLGAGAVAAKLGIRALARQYLTQVENARYAPSESTPATQVETRKELNALATKILASL
jgi:hypothetical protein